MGTSILNLNLNEITQLFATSQIQRDTQIFQQTKYPVELLPAVTQHMNDAKQ